MPRKDKTVVVYKGKEYVKYSGSRYYKNRTSQHSPELHRQIYIDTYGDIPHGYHVHHIDGNTDNNDIANLVALPAGEHTKETLRQMRGRSFLRKCDSCGCDFIVINPRARYCSKTCYHREWVKRNSDWLNEYKKIIIGEL